MILLIRGRKSLNNYQIRSLKSCGFSLLRFSLHQKTDHPAKQQLTHWISPLYAKKQKALIYLSTVIRYSWWVDLQSLLQSNRSMAVHDHDSIYLQTNKYLSEGFVNDYAILVRDIYSYPLQTAKGLIYRHIFFQRNKLHLILIRGGNYFTKSTHS